MSSQTRFVVNDNGGDGSSRTIHTAECHAIRHYVEGHHRYRGNSIAAEIANGYTPEYYSAAYATADELAGKRYKRCSHCCPDLPESTWRPRPRRRTVKAKSLRPHHVGLFFVEVGTLDGIEIRSNGYVLHSPTRTHWATDGDVLTYMDEVLG